MDIDFANAIFGLEKEVNVESGKILIKIPVGVRDGTELRFAGKGMPGPSGTPAGDLLLTLRVHKPRNVEISGDNLVTVSEIDIVTATIGGEISVTVVDTSQATGLGTAQLKIPAGTQHGSKFLIRGKGMPRLKGSGRGDVLVQVFVTVPKKVSRKQRELLEEYQRS